METTESKNKYEAALSLYDTCLNDEAVKEAVNGLLARKLAENDTPEVKKQLFHCIDLTTLNTTDTDIPTIVREILQAAVLFYD